MKRSFAVIFCVVMVLLLAIPSMAVESAECVGYAAGTADIMVLDGIMDGAYENGLIVDGSLQESDGLTGDTSVVYYVTYTDDALWIFAEIKDETLSAQLEDESQPTYKIDSIEVMLDPDNGGENTPDVMPWQARVDYQGNLSARKGQTGTSLYHSVEKNGNVDFYDAKAVLTEDGFHAEYRIPMENLEAGREIGFNFCYNDWDAAGAERITLTSTPLVGSWKTEAYNYFILDTIAEPEAETVPEAADVPAAAPLTADPAGMAAIICLLTVSAGGVISGRKKR